MQFQENDMAAMATAIKQMPKLSFTRIEPLAKFSGKIEAALVPGSTKDDMVMTVEVTPDSMKDFPSSLAFTEYTVGIIQKALPSVSVAGEYIPDVNIVHLSLRKTGLADHVDYIKEKLADAI